MLWIILYWSGWTRKNMNWYLESSTSWGNTHGTNIWRHGWNLRAFWVDKRMSHRPWSRRSSTRSDSGKPCRHTSSWYQINGHLLLSFPVDHSLNSVKITNKLPWNHRLSLCMLSSYDFIVFFRVCIAYIYIYIHFVCYCLLMWIICLLNVCW